MLKVGLISTKNHPPNTPIFSEQLTHLAYTSLKTPLILPNHSRYLSTQICN